MSKTFDPDWVVAPGETLADWFEAMNLPHRISWNLYEIPERTLKRLLAGEQKITPTLAQKLCNMTLVGAPFWLALEHNYRVGLAAGKTKIEETLTERRGLPQRSLQANCRGRSSRRSVSANSSDER